MAEVKLGTLKVPWANTKVCVTDFFQIVEHKYYNGFDIEYVCFFKDI